MICLRFLGFSREFNFTREHMKFSTVSKLAFLHAFKSDKNANSQMVEKIICSSIDLNFWENSKNLRHIILWINHYLKICWEKHGKNNTAKKKNWFSQVSLRSYYIDSNLFNDINLCFVVVLGAKITQESCRT